MDIIPLKHQLKCKGLLMGTISLNFDREEFECQCGCGFNTVDAELLKMVQAARDELGPIKINSACRCEAHNKAEGGSTGSQHKLGRAADLKPLHTTVDSLWSFLSVNFPESGIGRYNTFIHIDSRGHKARWNG